MGFSEDLRRAVVQAASGRAPYGGVDPAINEINKYFKTPPKDHVREFIRGDLLGLYQEGRKIPIWEIGNNVDDFLIFGKIIEGIRLGAPIDGYDSQTQMIYPVSLMHIKIDQKSIGSNALSPSELMKLCGMAVTVKTLYIGDVIDGDNSPPIFQKDRVGNNSELIIPYIGMPIFTPNHLISPQNSRIQEQAQERRRLRG